MDMFARTAGSCCAAAIMVSLAVLSECIAAGTIPRAIAGATSCSERGSAAEVGDRDVCDDSDAIGEADHSDALINIWGADRFRDL